jgi:type IV pilus assembly protein PilW
MRRPQLSTKRHQRGVSIIEIMITLTIGLFIIGGILYTFVSTRGVFSTNDALARVQEDSRMAMERLTREIRQAGFMGCSNTLDITPHVLADVSPHDGTPDVTYAAGDGIQVFDNGVGWVNPTGIARIAGTDVIQIKGLSACTAKLTGNMTADNANIQIGTNPCGWAANQVLVIADCTNADVFAANSVSSGSVTITHSSGSNTDPKLSKAYGKEAMIFGYGEVTFFVGMNTALNQPALYQVDYNGTTSTTNEIVGNVYDMQVVSVQSDTNTDGAPDSSILSTCSPQAWPCDQPTDPAPTLGAVTWSQMLSMQVRFSVRSESTTAGTTNQTYNFNGAAVTDRRIRRNYSTVIGIRNRLP